MTKTCHGTRATTKELKAGQARKAGLLSVLGLLRRQEQGNQQELRFQLDSNPWFCTSDGSPMLDFRTAGMKRMKPGVNE
jgi:hypothetical protein